MTVPLDQLGHFGREMHKVRRSRACARHHHVLLPIPACLFGVDALQDKRVKIPNPPLG